MAASAASARLAGVCGTVAAGAASSPFRGPELLQALFDLTPAEARIASLVIDGKSVDSISKIQSVSLNTVRTQLKSVFMKTGVDRQVDLVRLLGQRHVQHNS